MDRTAWIAIALATIGLVASIVWEQRQASEARLKFLQQQAILAAQATPTPLPTESPEPTAAAKLATQSAADQQPRDEQPEHDETLKSDVAELNFSNNRGGLATVNLLNQRYQIVHDMPNGDWRRKGRAGGYDCILVNGVVTHHRDVPTGATPGKLVRVSRDRRQPRAAAA